MPVALRVLHSWERMASGDEGSPASRETVYFIAERLLHAGCVDEAFAVLVALDCYPREQDWLSLLAEDVKVAQEDPSPFVAVAVLFGRKHRGERAKTGQAQGVPTDGQFLAQLIAARVSTQNDDDKVFHTTALRAGAA